MFKFIWIIMIAFVIGVFVAYTVYCCIQASKDASSLLEWYDNMDIDHPGLLVAWFGIIVISAIGLFITSLVAFYSSFG